VSGCFSLFNGVVCFLDGTVFMLRWWVNNELEGFQRKPSCHNRGTNRSFVCMGRGTPLSVGEVAGIRPRITPDP
jgi:hypothetical protein